MGYLNRGSKIPYSNTIQHLEFDGIPIKLSRKRVKYINLRIQRTGEVHVSAPRRCALAEVQAFLHQKRSWIEKHRQQLRNRLPDLVKNLETGELLFFLGLRYALLVHEGSLQAVEIAGGTLHLFVKTGASFAQKQKILDHWYREQMLQRLPALFEKWEAVIGVKAKTYGIKCMKSRWGSCNVHKKRIWLSLSLMQRPLMALEYVIVHELVHLLEASHNQRFYALMGQFMPEFQTAQKMLKQW